MRTHTWALWCAGLLLAACDGDGKGAGGATDTAAADTGNPDAGGGADGTGADGADAGPDAGGVLPAGLVAPGDLTYVGAFRLPVGEERPRTFEYGGGAMTFRPDGDPGGPADGFAGSLFVMGHDRLPYGEMPNGNQVAEVSIPAPAVGALASLPRATLLQGFAETTGTLFTDWQELPRAGLQYLDDPVTGPVVHVAFGAHFEDTPLPTHGLFAPDLTAPSPQGAWILAGGGPYETEGYMLELPAAWATAHAEGRVLGTGRYRDGGWSGKGPTLFAYVPWSGGALAAPGASLPATPLLRYESSQVEGSSTHRALAGYQHADEWEGAAFLTTQGGKQAVIFAGTKGVGAKYWYGYIHPGGPALPCVEVEMVGQFPICLTAAGADCPPADLTGCGAPLSYRGWWSSAFEARMMFYDPADLAAVAAGTLPSYAPQPYATLSIDEHLLLNPAGIEPEMLGTGPQRRYRIGEVAYDRAGGHIFVLELFADGAAPVVHVFAVGG